MVQAVDKTSNNLTKPDIRIIGIHYNLGKYFGLTPEGFRTGLTSFWKWYVSILLLVSVALVAHTVKGRMIIFKEYGSVLENFIDGTQCFSELVYISVSLLATRFCPTNWKSLFENIDRTEERLQQNDFGVNKSIILFKIEATIYHLIFLAVHLGETVSWVLHDELNNTYIYLSFRLATYYQVYDVILVCAFNQMIQRRYKYLNKVVQKTMKGANGILRRSEEGEKISKLRDVFSMYQMLHESVKRLEIIFGWKIFIILECTILSVLNSFHYALTNLQSTSIENVLEKEFIFIIIFPVLFVVSLPHINIFFVSICFVVDDGWCSCNVLRWSREEWREISSYLLLATGQFEDVWLERRALFIGGLYQTVCTENISSWFLFGESTFAGFYVFVCDHLRHYNNSVQFASYRELNEGHSEKLQHFRSLFLR